MPNTVIAIKKSATPSAQPTVLANGELAINYADGKLFYKHANGTILPFNTQGGNAFGTINANGTLVVADTSQAVATLLAGNNIIITGDAINDTITIGLRNDLTIPGTAYLKAAGGDEGGELQLANAVTNSVLSGNVVIDVYQNKIRFFEQSGTNRGAFINIASAAAGVGTDLLSAASSTDTVARNAASAAYDKANSSNIIASAAYDKANSANILAFNTGTGANAFASATIAGANAAVGTGANAFTSATIAGANTIAIAAFNQANTANVGSGGYYQGNRGEVSPSNYGDIFRIHSNTLTQNVTILSGNNAIAVGPINIPGNNTTLTIQTGSRVVII